MTEEGYIEVYEYQSFPDSVRIKEENFEDFKVNFINTHFLKLLHKSKDQKTNEFVLNLKANFYIGTARFPQNQNFKILPRFKNAKFNEMFKNIKELKYENILFDIFQKLNPSSDFIKNFIENFLNITEKLISTGLRKNYKYNIQKTNIIKGKIIIGESIKRSDFIYGKFMCQFEDFKLDTTDNQLIKLALFYLRFNASPNQQFRIRRLLIPLKNVRLRKFTSTDFDRIKYDRFNIKYQKVHAYCMMFIKKFSFGFESGKRECFPMFLNAWDIYEKYLRVILEKYLKESFSKDILVMKNLGGKNFNSWDKKKNIPDIVIMIDNKVLLLGDAKYKKEIKASDRHQAGNYLRCIKKIHNLKEINFEKENRNIILFYPYSGNKEDDASRTLIFKDLEKNDKDEIEGRIYAYWLDLSRLDDEIYLRTWVNKIAEKFLIRITD